MRDILIPIIWTVILAALPYILIDKKLKIRYVTKKEGEVNFYSKFIIDKKCH